MSPVRLRDNRQNPPPPPPAAAVAWLRRMRSRDGRWTARAELRERMRRSPVPHGLRLPRYLERRAAIARLRRDLARLDRRAAPRGRAAWGAPLWLRMRGHSDKLVVVGAILVACAAGFLASLAVEGSSNLPTGDVPRSSGPPPAADSACDRADAACARQATRKSERPPARRRAHRAAKRRPRQKARRAVPAPVVSAPVAAATRAAPPSVTNRIAPPAAAAAPAPTRNPTPATPPAPPPPPPPHRTVAPRPPPPAPPASTSFDDSG